MKKLKKIAVFSFAKFQAFMGVLIGLIFGILYSFGGLIIDTLVSSGYITSSETPGLSFGTILAFGALLGMPIIFGTAGFLLGIVEAILYNLFAKWLSWIKIDFERKV